MLKNNFNNFIAFLYKNRCQVLALLLGGFYFLAIILLSDVKAGDYKTFVSQPIDIFYGIGRWFNWSSRLFIESSVNVFSKNLYVWAAITVLMGSVMFWSIGRILENKRIYQSFITFFIMLFVNFYILTTAGVFATTVNYLWPIACLLFVFAIILKPFSNKVLHKVSSFLIWPVYIYALCSEQLALISIILISVYIIYKLYKRQKIQKKIFFLLFLAIVGMLNIFICPGNDNRVLQETSYWWPSFATFSLKEKAIVGVSVTFSRIFLSPELLIIILVALISILSYKKKNLVAFFCILPTIIVEFLTLIPTDLISNSSVYLPSYLGNIRNIGLSINPNNILSNGTFSKISFLLFFAFMISIMSAIFFIYGKTVKSLCVIALIVAGLLSSLAISMSPTIFASSTRTLYPFIIILLIINSLLVKDAIFGHFEKNLNRK